MAISYITDATGKQTAVVIDIESWNNFARMNSEALYQLHGNTFSDEYLKESRTPGIGIFGQPLNLLGTDNFSVDGTEN